MGVMINMMTQLTRLAFTRAAAFFYAVAVGVVANVIIAHLSPHPGDQATGVDAQPATVRAADVPVATAVIAPKPAAPPAPIIDTNASSTAPSPTPASPVMPVAASQAATQPTPPTPDSSASANLPSPATLTPPPVKPVAVSPVAVSTAPAATTGTPAADAKPAAKTGDNTEAAALPPPVSLLPQADPASDQPAPKPANPGPGSGGLY
jgi:hypothetical protein